MKYNTILVDLDDTLVVEEKSADASFMACAAHLKKYHAVDAEDFVSTVKSAARELWYSLPTHPYARAIGIASREALWAEFSDTNENQRELLTYRDYYRRQAWINALSKYAIHDDDLAFVLSLLFIEERNARHVLFDDTLRFLNVLRGRGCRLALITNGTPDLQRRKIGKSGIESYFSCIAISGEVGHRKPERTIFLRCLDALGAGADDAVMIGDRLDADIKGANDVGLCSVWLNRENRENDTNIKPCHEIKNLGEFIAMVEQNWPDCI